MDATVGMLGPACVRDAREPVHHYPLLVLLPPLLAAATVRDVRKVDKVRFVCRRKDGREDKQDSGAARSLDPRVVALERCARVRRKVVLPSTDASQRGEGRRHQGQQNIQRLGDQRCWWRGMHLGNNNVGKERVCAGAPA